MDSLELPELSNRARGVQGLAAGTLVTTPDGEKKIEDVIAGDMVLSGVGEGVARFYEVATATSNSYSGPMLTITTDHANEIRATPNHICFGIIPREEDEYIWVAGTVFLQAFCGLNKDNFIEHMVCAQHHYYPKPETNLDSAEKVARSASRANGGEEIHRVAMFCGDEHPDDEPFDFLPASSLQVNYGIPITMRNSVHTARITSITEEHYDGLVYDLDIPESRNFAANGVLVHDSRAPNPPTRHT